MEENDFGAAGVSTSTDITKPVTEIAKIMSNEFLKLYELDEYCNTIESDLGKWYKKLEALITAKNESLKILTEYKNKDKINVINSERSVGFFLKQEILSGMNGVAPYNDLLQALNEVLQYKSELKSTYIASEKALKMKKLKYRKTISSYESAWQETLKEYNTDPLVVELINAEQENALLEKEIEKQEKLNSSTETQWTDLKENLKKAFIEKTVEFSKVMLQYKQIVNSTNKKGEDELLKQNLKRGFHFKLRNAIPHCDHSENKDDACYSCSIDVSIFDDITVPSENLESQNLEEDGTLADVSKEEETSEYLNNDNPQTTQYQTSIKENSAQSDENESHYFRVQTSETSRQFQSEQPQPGEQWDPSKENFNKQLDNSGEKLKSAELQRGDNGEDSSRDMQMECDESLSDGSYEKQMTNQKGDDSQYHKTSSVSSDDLPPSTEILNESPEPVRKVFKEDNKRDMHKNDFEGFGGFFSMGNDQNTSKPSIFKLF